MYRYVLLKNENGLGSGEAIAAGEDCMAKFSWPGDKSLQ